MPVWELYSIAFLLFKTSPEAKFGGILLDRGREGGEGGREGGREGGKGRGGREGGIASQDHCYTHACISLNVYGGFRLVD